MPRALALLVLLCSVACRGTRPSDFADETGPLVLVKEARIPSGEPWYAQFAWHGWFDVRAEQGGPWTRIEISSPYSGVRVDDLEPHGALADERWGDRPVRVRAVLRGDEARAAAASLLESAGGYAGDHYRAYPGPNSNSFVATLVDDAPHLRTTLHHNAVGKDYAAPISVSRTPSKTGVRLDTTVLGFAVGVQEGVELRLVGLTLGVGLWPPRISVPILPEIGPALSATGA